MTIGEENRCARLRTYADVDSFIFLLFLGGMEDDVSTYVPVNGILLLSVCN